MPLFERLSKRQEAIGTELQMPTFAKVLACVAALLLACSAQTVVAEPKVITSIKPLQLLAAEIQNGLGQPTVLLPPGASPHNYFLRPSDLTRLRDADLVYWIGPDLEVFLIKTLNRRLRPTVAVQELSGMHLRHFGEVSTAAGKESAAELPGDEHDDVHREGSLDAHIWLRPSNALIIARHMADDLSAIDPANSARYQANFESFSQRLAAKDLQLKSRLGALVHKPFFVFHQTFDYFEEAYGLRHAGVLAVGSSDAQPGARHVADMRKKLELAGPSCVFSEPPLRPRLAETLTAGLPVQFAELDALGFGFQAVPGGYEKLIGTLGDDLARCLERL